MVCNYTCVIGLSKVHAPAEAAYGAIICLREVHVTSVGLLHTALSYQMNKIAPLRQRANDVAHSAWTKILTLLGL